jgi:single-stranded-DNA-specific exonuclease
MRSTINHKPENISLSARGAIWRLREADSRKTLTFCQRYNIPEPIARVLVQRGIELDEVEDFLVPKLKNSLPDPLHLLDMEKGASRLAEAIINQEKIAIFGDYDVDGATSSALLIRFLRACNLSARLYIPDRISEGYGPNVAAMEKLAAEKIKLCITVDCGTVSFEPLAAAKKLGLDVIVVDHHLGNEILPEAIAVINPNRLDETSEHRNLAAVGVTFLLLIATSSKLTKQGFFSEKNKPDLLQFLDCVALGTVCDVMQLTGINRVFVAQGLKILHQRSNLGLRILSDRAALNTKPSSYHLGFILGPRINAGGRVGKSDLGSKLLSTEDPAEAAEIAEILEQHNAERKAIESLVLEEAIAQVNSFPQLPAMIFVKSQDWHPGVIGIVAGRLKENFHRPVAVISLHDDIGKASVRSIEGCDIGKALANAKTKGLLIAGGGHSMAAGFTVTADKIDELQEYLCSEFKSNATLGMPCLNLDMRLSPSAITLDLIELLSQLAPFGTGNPEPKILLSSVALFDVKPMGEEHLRARIADKATGVSRSASLNAVAFRVLGSALGDMLLNSSGKTINLVGKAQINSWKEKSSAQFIIEDACFD